MPKFAIVFPGQGAQHVGMGRDVFDLHPEFVRKSDEMLGVSIRELCLSDGERRLSQTQYTQPAIFTVSALSFIERRKGMNEEPAFMLGHSVGELVALFAAGCVDFEVALWIVRKRGALMAEATGGGMCAVLGDNVAELHSVLPRIAPDLDIANLNTDRQIVLSGPTRSFAALEAIAEERDWHLVRLNVSGAFHSRYMEPAARRFEALLRDVEFRPPQIPVIANVTALPYPSSADEIRAMLVRQLTHPVRWTDSVRYVRSQGCVEFSEVGPGSTLTGLIAKIR
jgi:malonyl CoA-acyl carrier protein transacylase